MNEVNKMDNKIDKEKINNKNNSNKKKDNKEQEQEQNEVHYQTDDPPFPLPWERGGINE